MNFRKITLKYLAWCPGIESAARFIPAREFDSRLVAPVALMLFTTLFIMVPLSIGSYIESQKPPEDIASVIRVERIQETTYDRNFSDFSSDSLYEVEYEVRCMLDEIITIKDQILQGLRLNEEYKIPIQLGVYKQNVTYEPSDGSITIEIPSIKNPRPWKVDFFPKKRLGRYLFRLLFRSDSVNMFPPGHQPGIVCDPERIIIGRETDFEIRISPFKLTDTTNLKTIRISVVFLESAEEIKYLSSSPEADVQLDGTTMWYCDAQATEFQGHSVKYHLKKSARGTLFLIRIDLVYNVPIYAREKPYFREGPVDFIYHSTISYEYRDR